MIRVYIRDEAEEEGIFLGEFFPEDISGLPSLFKEFETIIKGEDDVAHFVGAEFVCDHTGTHFEIVVSRG